jgi:hypothetical protein
VAACRGVESAACVRSRTAWVPDKHLAKQTCDALGLASAEDYVDGLWGAYGVDTLPRDTLKQLGGRSVSGLHQLARSTYSGSCTSTLRREAVLGMSSTDVSHKNSSYLRPGSCMFHLYASDKCTSPALALQTPSA